MPGTDGPDALQQIRAASRMQHVVMMTGTARSQTSIDAIRSGAFSYLTKPLDLDQLRSVIRQALAARQGRRRAADDDSGGESQQPRVALAGGRRRCRTSTR